MKIKIGYILLGLIIGIILVYLSAPGYRTVYRYPNLENIKSTVYVDENDHCFVYEAREIPGIPDRISGKCTEV
jgi:hypothetical protein